MRVRLQLQCRLLGGTFKAHRGKSGHVPGGLGGRGGWKGGRRAGQALERREGRVGAEIPDGAVLVARSIVNSSLWTMRPDDRVVAITCIALANKAEAKWWNGSREIVIQRGQFVRSREQMVKACNLPLQRFRTSVQHLENSRFLTREVTKMYTLYNLPKYDHYQTLSKYSDSVIYQANPETNPRVTQDQPTPNHKQQQQKNRPSIPKPSKADKAEGTGGDAVVVVDRSSWPDPILGKPSFRIASGLLEEIKVAKALASGFAAAKPLGQILRVVQQARLQKNPGGWGRMALENDWVLPEAAGHELEEVVRLVKEDVEKADKYFLSKAPMSGQKLVERKAGESEEDWLRRANDELKARRTRSNSARPAKSPGA